MRCSRGGCGLAGDESDPSSGHSKAITLGVSCDAAAGETVVVLPVVVELDQSSGDSKAITNGESDISIEQQTPFELGVARYESADRSLKKQECKLRQSGYTFF